MSGVKGQRSGGHNKKPTAYKKITGTIRPGRTNKREPKVAFGAPPAPRWLCPEGLEHYARLSELVTRTGVVSEVDGEALALAANALVEYIEAREAVREEGLIVEQVTTVVTKDGRTTHHVTKKANPAVAARSDAWRRYQLGLRLFGLDPQSRSSVSAINGNIEQDDGAEEEDFFGASSTPS